MKRIFIAGLFILFVVIVNAQNVGIGKTNPQAKLEIKQTSSLEPTVMLSDSVGGYGGRLRFRSLLSQYSNRSWYTDYILGTHSKDNEISIYNDSTNVMNIYGTGNITIGDAVVPNARLTIFSDNPSSDILNVMGASNQPALKITGDRNVGIGTPTPLQKLDVNGAVKIGTTATNQPGTIRYNGGNFEGGNGSSWKSFEALPSKAIILARSIDTAGLRLVGFNVFKASDVVDVIDVTIPTNLPGQWNGQNNTFTEPNGVYNNENVQYNNKLIFYNAEDGMLYQHDITTELWSQLPGISPLSLRFYYSMTLVGNEIYIFGGYRNGPFTAYNDGAKYNLLTNTWSSVAAMPVGSFIHASCAIGIDIYIIGGASTISSGIQLEKKLYRYNTVTNTWSADLTNSSTPFAIQGNALVRNNKILLVGGEVIEYNPALNSYSILADVINTTYSTISSLVGDDIYVYGSIRDTIFSPPPAQANPIWLHYKVNLLNGQSTSLNNLCNLSFNYSYYTYRYVSSVNKFYFKNGTGYAFDLFNPAGSFPCNIVGSYNSLLYYLQKQ